MRHTLPGFLRIYTMEDYIYKYRKKKYLNFAVCSSIRQQRSKPELLGQVYMDTPLKLDTALNFDYDKIFDTGLKNIIYKKRLLGKSYFFIIIKIQKKKL